MTSLKELLASIDRIGKMWVDPLVYKLVEAEKRRLRKKDAIRKHLRSPWLVPGYLLRKLIKLRAVIK